MAIESLPRREREVFELLCGLGQATTAMIRDGLADPLSDSAVRTLLSRLEAKGLVTKTTGADGNLYRPAPQTDQVAAGALKRMVDTFFAGSAAKAATALLGQSPRLDAEEIAELERLIDQARERG